MGPSICGLQGSKQYKRIYKVQTTSFEMKNQCLNIGQHCAFNPANAGNKQQDLVLFIQFLLRVRS